MKPVREAKNESDSWIVVQCWWFHRCWWTLISKATFRSFPSALIIANRYFPIFFQKGIRWCWIVHRLQNCPCNSGLRSLPAAIHVSVLNPFLSSKTSVPLGDEIANSHLRYAANKSVGLFNPNRVQSERGRSCLKLASFPIFFSEELEENLSSRDCPPVEARVSAWAKFYF